MRNSPRYARPAPIVTGWDSDPAPSVWSLISNHDLDRVTLDDALDLTPRDEDPEDENRLTLLDELAARYLDPIDRLIYRQILKCGMSANQIAPATGLTRRRVTQRADEITTRLRVLAHAPPLPPAPDETDLDSRACWLYADFRSLPAIALALGLNGRRRAWEAVERGITNACPSVVERIHYRRTHWRRGRYRTARSEIVTGVDR